MRPLALLFLALSLTSAEVEQITLNDGRKLIGTYDDQAGLIILDGPAKASIRVKRSQVVKREPYEAPPATPPQPITTAPPVVAPAPQPLPVPPPVIARTPAPDDALKLAQAEAKKLRSQADRIEFEATKRWLIQEIATPVEEPKIGPDPRASELEAYHKSLALYNRYLHLKEFEKQSRIAEGEDIMQVVYHVAEIRERDARWASGKLLHNDR